MFKSRTLHLIKEGGQHLVTFKVSDFFTFNVIQVCPYFTPSGHSSLFHISVTMGRSPGHYVGLHTTPKHTDTNGKLANMLPLNQL